GVLVMDAASGEVLLANSQAAEIFGATRGRMDDQGWTGYHTDGRPYSPGEWPVERVRSTGEPVSDEEVEIIRPDEARAIVRISARPLHDDKGEMTAVLAVFTDITQQRRR